MCRATTQPIIVDNVEIASMLTSDTTFSPPANDEMNSHCMNEGVTKRNLNHQEQYSMITG